MQPRIYDLSSHGIELEHVDRHALYVLEKLQDAGHIAYLVGGGVRDLLLKQTPKDFDISTSAKPEEVKKLFNNCILIGRRFRLAHVRFGKKILEVSTFRAGDQENDALIVRDNEWGTPEEDVLRRDFTINGLFYNSRDQTVIDYVGGYEDLQKNTLRCIGQPYIRFKQDPVRMIRLLKFEARFGFEVDPDARQALLDCRSEILKSSQARIFEELLRMLELGSSRRFYTLMNDYGLLHQLLPTLAEFLETPDGADIFDYLEEIDLAIREGSLIDLERPVLLSAFVYPILCHRIDTHYPPTVPIPHMGVIQDEATSIVESVFHPVFQVPKRIKAIMIFILASQLRFTPLEMGGKRRIRVPGIPDFHLALAFLSLRARLEPGLTEIYDEWKEAYDQSPKVHYEEAPYARRRSRSRR